MKLVMLGQPHAHTFSLSHTHTHTHVGIIPAIARNLVHEPLITGNKLRQFHSLKAEHAAKMAARGSER